MPSPSTPHIAIVGSGPAGCYLASALLRALPDCEITLFDRLASPYGLIRYGVAADHQHTKAITRQFERLFANPGVRFAGDITIGRDVTLAELEGSFDAVVLATGRSADRPLPVPGGDLPGVIGSGAITRALNSHPGTAPLPPLGSDVVIVGAGNVALDLLRFLVKDRSGYAASDVADPVLEAYLADPVQRITVLSRSDAARSKGDPQMIKELIALPRGRYTTSGAMCAPEHAPSSTPEARTPESRTAEARTAEARTAAYTDLTAPTRIPTAGPDVQLIFGATPERVRGDGHVTAVDVQTGAGLTSIPATAVLTAIGFDSDPADELARLCAAPSPESGRLRPGLYRTGWAKRGPNGAIPENRACAKAVADEIVSDIAAGMLVPNAAKRGFAALPAHVREQAITFAQWGALDAHEQASAHPDRVRQKLTDHAEMAAIARGTADTRTPA
ncbi:FAD-dependent oxidoreductase [Leucobacter chromiireducens]|uniref:ferredoxin--NADP(+) reductase n=1 Tax=Leucobacter chromiireducens subsp. chromiireducens TaxID=660067 RepID=A0ABS1SLS0_9MICO|nr:FAD-dependent oxidoreductase [Leucobacter chromiireducens]MBL3689131.1 hypothetical protein [Leucobacter chromiireducens subsp. chromiireducens]